MHRIALTILTATLCFAADDPWAKVQELKTGAEIRIFKKGSATPVLAQFGDATEDRLVILQKNRQTSIPKEEIDRLDARPKPGNREISRTTATKTKDPDFTPHPNPQVPASETSSSTSIGISGGKADFETLYRRPAKLPPSEAGAQK